MEECFFKISYGDWVMITMGAGVGYFLIGYLVAKALNEYRNNQEDILIAREIE
jgi:hypothetical protein